jgi:hypothetical protein
MTQCVWLGDVPQCDHPHLGDARFLQDVSCNPLAIYEVEFPSHEPAIFGRIVLREDQIETTDGETQ